MFLSQDIGFSCKLDFCDKHMTSDQLLKIQYLEKGTFVSRRGATGGGWGRVPPSCFGKFGHSFLGFWEKISLNLLRFWEKISLKFSPILGENHPQIFSDFQRKYTSKRFFDPFSHFQKYPPPAFTSSRRPCLLELPKLLFEYVYSLRII